MNKLVRYITDDDGCTHRDSHLWHLVNPTYPAGGEASLCEQEYFGIGESTLEYETKTATRGGITCPDCLGNLKAYKAVKL
jgi:hypothetical protein